MKRYLSILLIFIGLVSCNNSENQATEPRPVEDKPSKVLFICTSESVVNGMPNGTFLSEIAVPFALLEEQGYEMDIVSPTGGPIPIYYKFDTTEVIQKALQSPDYLFKTAHSKKTNEIDPSNYQAIILPGGYGQFWDIHLHPPTLDLIRDVYESGGYIGALGHGTSTLALVTLSNGQPLVKGKTMTCFPSWFEREVMTEANYGELLPFDMENLLEEKGALLKRVDKETWSNKEIVDDPNRIITASSATGGRFIATNLHRLLSNQPGQ